MRVDKLTGLALVAVIAAVLLVGSAEATAPSTPADGAISLSAAGQSGGARSDVGLTAARQVSADGRYVVFVSNAGNLVLGDTNGLKDVFLRDTQTGVTTRVDVSSAGAQATGGDSSGPTITADGRYVAFSSGATNLVTGDTNGFKDIFVRDTQAGTTTRASVDSSSVPGDGDSSQPAFSGDGHTLAFVSSSSNLVGFTTGQQNVFMRDLQAGTTTLVSAEPGGGEGDGSSGEPSVSGDGRIIAFSSSATNLAGADGNSHRDVFLRDTQMLTTTRISIDSQAHEATGGDSRTPSISTVGNTVAFYSDATNLVAGDLNNAGDVFLRDGGAGMTRVSVGAGGIEAIGGASDHPSISGDGRYVAFSSLATNLIGGNDTNSASDAFVRDTQAGTTTRVSIATGGAQSDGDTVGTALSADGRYLLFGSAASNLAGTTDTNGLNDVFLRDRQLGTTALESSIGAGSTGAGSSSTTDGTVHQLSADGRYVVFASSAADLVGAADTHGNKNVFIRDTQAGTTTCVSVAPGGAAGNNQSDKPSISADGRYVAFRSSADDLVAGDTNNAADIFVRDRQAGTTTRVSVGAGGVQGNLNGDSFAPTISPDGRYVAFASGATNLVTGDTNGVNDVFVRDTQAGTTTRVSVGTGGVQASNYSINPAISDDGRYVTFGSSATNLVASDTNGVNDEFMRDTQAGTTTRVSVGSSGAQANSSSQNDAAISGDGRYVTFTSSATNLVAGDNNGSSDVFLRDIQAGTTVRVSIDSSGAEGNNASYSPSIDANTRYISFSSDATNFTAGDTNGATDVFVRSLQTGVTRRVSVAPGGGEATGVGFNGSDFSSLSADGRYIAFFSGETNMGGNDWNGVDDVFLRDLGAAPTIASASVNGQTLTLSYSETLTGTAPASAYTVHAGSGTVAVSSAAMSGSSVTLTLASAVTSAQSVTVDYVLPAASPVADLYGHAVLALSARAIVNQTPGVAGGASSGEATTVTGSTATSGTSIPGTAGSITTGSGATAATVTWSAAGIAAQPVTVSVSPAPGVVAGTGSFAAGATAIQVTVTTAGGAAVTEFSAPLDLQFPNAAAGVVPAFTHDGLTWSAIPELTGTTLPVGYHDGWYRDSTGLLHVLTLHATYFGLLQKGSTVAPALSFVCGTAGIVNLNYRRTLQLNLKSSLPSAVTVTLSRGGKALGSWHPTLTTDARIVAIVIPRAARKVGTYRVAITTKAIGSTLQLTRSVTVRFTASRHT